MRYRLCASTWLAGLLRLAFPVLLFAALPCQAAKPRMDFELPEAVTGQPLKLSRLAARATVVNFWTNGCAPCLKELQWLSALAEARPDVRFIGVALDERDKVLSQLQAAPLSFTNVIAPADPRELLRSFGNGIVAMPFTAILNADRTTCWGNLGELNRPAFEKAFDYCTKSQH